jgi:hypothetical protein
MRAMGLLFVLTAMIGAGCASGPRAAEDAPPPAKVDKNAAKVANQAAFDLQCDAAQLQVAVLSADMGGMLKTYGVRGCGRQATYKVSCSMFGCTVFNEAQSASIAAGAAGTR